MESHTILQTTNTNGDTEEIPRALIFDILSWMPTKSVCRFKSCSKFINEFTNDSYFAMKHSKNSILKDDSCFFVQTIIYGFQDCKTETQIHALPGDHESSCGTVPLKFLNFLDENFATIVASSKGLLLCMTTRESGHPIQLFICNPITQSYSLIPMPYEENPKTVVAFAFECDDVDVEEYYRLLALQYGKRSSASLGCKIYLPKEGVWKSRQGFFGNRLMRSSLPVFCKGAFHFLQHWDPCYHAPGIASYNLRSDLTRRFNLPEEALNSGGLSHSLFGIFKWGKIGSSSESICLVKLVDHTTIFTIWVLTNYESSSNWSKFLTISLQEMGLIRSVEKKPSIFVTKFIVMNGNSLVFATFKNVYRYDLIGERERRVEKVCDHGYLWDSVFTSYSRTLRSCGPGAISLY